MVAELGLTQEWFLYARADSPINSAKELKGARIGITRLGSMEHAFVRALLKALALERRDIKIVAAGGTLEKMAALKSGTVDLANNTLVTMAGFEDQGITKRVLRTSDYAPTDTVTLFATRNFLEKDAHSIPGVIKALALSVDFVLKDYNWARQTLKRERGYSDRVADKVYEFLKRAWFVTDGRINVKRIQEARDFLVNYSLTSKEKTPSVNELYTGKFVPIE